MRAGVYDARDRCGLTSSARPCRVVVEGGVLLEVRLELADPRLEPVLEPALAELVLDAMEAPVAHGFMIGTQPDGRNEPNGLTCGASRPIPCEPIARGRCAARVNGEAVRARVLLVANNAYEPSTPQRACSRAPGRRPASGLCWTRPGSGWPLRSTARRSSWRRRSS